MSHAYLLAILLCCCSVCSHAADLSVHVVLPAKIVVPRPTDALQQTHLRIRFVLRNEGSEEVRIGILEQDRPTWYAPTIVFKLTDQVGKEIEAGFQPTENLAGNRQLKELRLVAGRTITLRYYKEVPFLIRSEGTYKLSVVARVQDREGAWIEKPLSPCTFDVEWSDRGGERRANGALESPPDEWYDRIVVVTPIGRMERVTRQYTLEEIEAGVSASQATDPFNIQHPVYPREKKDLEELKRQFKAGDQLCYFRGLDSGWAIVRNWQVVWVLVTDHQW